MRSISDTWLRFPVGTGYAYSNLGIDLAGYILERVEGKPFAEVMRDSLLEPLGMDHSTFDRAVIRATADRAVGHVHPYPEPPLDVPMTAAGGLYTSAADLARFLRFQLNGGTIDGRAVLDPKWLEEMRTVPPPHAGAPAGYALGVVRHRWNRWDQRPDLFEHGGGGYGFLSDLWWAAPAGDRGRGPDQLRRTISSRTISRCRSSATSSASRACTSDRLLALPWRPPVDGSERWRSRRRPGWRTSSPTPPWPRRVTRPPAGRATPAPTGRPRGACSTWNGPPDRFLVDAGVPYFEADDNATSRSFATASPRSSPACSSPTTARRSTSGDRFRPGGTSGSFASRAALPEGPPETRTSRRFRQVGTCPRRSSVSPLSARNRPGSISARR